MEPLRLSTGDPEELGPVTTPEEIDELVGRLGASLQFFTLVDDDRGFVQAADNSISTFPEGDERAGFAYVLECKSEDIVYQTHVNEAGDISSFMKAWAADEDWQPVMEDWTVVHDFSKG